MPVPVAQPGQHGFSAQRLQRIDQVLSADIAAGQLPGAVVLVARRGCLVHATALGVQDPATGVPMELDSIFRIFSMTKPVTSVAALMLMEEGRLQLSDPVSEFVPQFRAPMVSVAQPGATGTLDHRLVPATRAITLHDLLTHSSGLTYGERSANAPVREAQARLGIAVNPRELSSAEFVDRLAQAPLAHQPASTWDYGFSTDLLGAIVETVTGESLGRFLASRLFEPLGMTDTGFHVGPTRAARIAQPFAIDPVSGEILRVPGQIFDAAAKPRMESGGAGALSTAADYCRFAQMLLCGGELDGVRVLSRSSVMLMTSDHLGTRIATPVTPGEAAMQSPGYGFGLGVAVRLADGLALVPGSAGDFFWSGTAGTSFFVDPKLELVTIFMAQAPGVSRLRYRRLMRQLVYQSIAD